MDSRQQWCYGSQGTSSYPPISPVLVHIHRREVIWIDVVCVNQEDDDEANKQAAMMREIYRHASRVIVWLGPQSNAQDAFLASETLSYVAMSPPSTSTQSLQNLLKSLQGRCALGLNVVAGLLYQFNRQWVVPVVTVYNEVHIIY